VIETLFSLQQVGVGLATVGFGGEGVERFFTRLLRDGFALSASGVYRPFGEVADGALAALAPDLDAAARRQVLDAFGRLDVQPDARPCLERLAGGALPLVALTNGSGTITTSLLERAELAEFFTEVISIDEVGTWKPAAAPYLHAAKILGVEPGQLGFVAVHAWDVHGAHHAGLVTGWASRHEGSFPGVFAAPHVSGADLVEVAEGLLALSPR
jgi:2-haloacid dehalogenase